MKKTNQNPKLMIKEIYTLKGIGLLLLLLIVGQDVLAQTPILITRATFNAAPNNIQRKYVENMPLDFEVHDLVNYPVSRTPDADPRPGVTYLTVYDFYYNYLPGNRLDALLDPAHYFIARDSLSIPVRIMAPAPHETQIKQ